MGTSQLLSVPYAIYARSSGNLTGEGLADGTEIGNTPYWDGTSWVTSSSNIYNNGSKVGIGVSTPEFKLHVSDDASFNNVRVGTGNGSSNVKTNTAIGFEVLKNNTVGNYNTAGGYYSLSNNTSGNFNTAFGDYTLFNNTTGNANTAVGNYSLFSIPDLITRQWETTLCSVIPPAVPIPPSVIIPCLVILPEVIIR